MIILLIGACLALVGCEGGDDGGGTSTTQGSPSETAPQYTTLTGRWRVEQHGNPSWPDDRGDYLRIGVVEMQQSGGTFTATWVSSETSDISGLQPANGTVSRRTVHIVGGSENPQVFDGTVNEAFTEILGTWGIPAYGASGGTWSATRQ